MADEPTWEDLFGEPLAPKQPAPAEQPPVAPTAAQSPVQPAAQPAAQPSGQQVPTTPHAAQQPYQAHAAQAPAAQVPPAPVAQTPATVPPAAAQPTYVSTLRTPPPATTRQAVPPANLPPAGDRRDSRGSSRGPDGRKPRRRLTWLWVLIVLIVLGAGGVGTVWAAFGPQIRHVMGWEPSIDYTGTGNGKAAEITIVPGQFGSDVANSLYKAGVTKTAASFYDLLLKQKKAPNFEPGTYKLQQQMSAKSALTALINPANRVVSNVVIPEGFNLTQIETRLSLKTGVKVADFQAAAADWKQFKLPPGAVSLEGYLFPATYQFSPGTTAVQEFQAMVTRMNQALAQHKVPVASAAKVLTLASIIQKEAGIPSDFPKVSRVFTNRIAKGMLLQSDATVSYGTGSTSIFTTGAQRADPSNKYNTYVHPGLPIGPIAAPGDAAIDAALHPTPGPWLYFVLVNGNTGETVFSTTIQGQDAAIKQWQAWLKAHPGYGK